MTSLLRRFVSANQTLSWSIDRMLLPDRLRLDGNKDFRKSIVPGWLLPGLTVYDLGGGSNPYLDPASKEELKLKVVGLDISQAELDAAPQGAYDTIIAADLCTFRGNADGDLVICQATLEHVPDTAGAIRAIAETLSPGGLACIFAPSRNAVFARLNLLLPETVKRKILFTLFPHKAEGHDGFKAYYDRCTPAEIEALARANGLEVIERRLYWTSSYFSILVPAFLLWRLWQGVHWLAAGPQAAETFAFVLKRPEHNERPATRRRETVAS